MSMLNTMVDAIARAVPDGQDGDGIETVIDSSVISPGLAGFIAVLILALAALALLTSMMRRLRRVRYREEVRAKIAIELAERDGHEPPGAATEPGPEK